MIAWLEDLNRQVLADYNTRILGGFDEPFYRAPVDDAPAEIRFTRNYERSALHELAHWCVAGSARRLQDDYGYWYAPDGRNGVQQQLFFQVEIKPQAIEKHFCTALGVPFAVSIDNLDNPHVQGLADFRRKVDAQFDAYTLTGLPARAAAIAGRLDSLRNKYI
jgi:elongation factor P hydroxylase